MHEPVYILGGVQTDFAKAWSRNGQDLSDMVREATLGALEASQLDAQQIESVHVGNAFAERHLEDFDPERLRFSFVGGIRSPNHRDPRGRSGRASSRASRSARSSHR